MKNLLKQILDFFLFSNVFMALCAVAQALVTYHLIGAEPSCPVLLLLFAATLGLYNFCILITRPQHAAQSPHRRVKWFFGNHKLMVVFTMISILALVPLFFMLSLASQVLLVFMGLLSVSYGLPLFSAGRQKFGLRNIPGLKSVLITLVWVLSTVLLPVLEAQHAAIAEVNARDIALLLAKRALFIGALTVPFDIRDLFDDRRAGLKTIAVVWGEKNAYLYCQALLAGYIVLLFLFRGEGFTPDFFALAFTAFLMGWLIFKSAWQKNEYYYFFYMDGVLILQYVFLIVFNYLWHYYGG